MLVVFLTAAFAGDLNCNGYDEQDEQPVNLADPVCAAQIDPATGMPYPTRDSYFDYVTYGCNYLLEDILDEDNDGYGAGTISMAGQLVTLECDVCPTVHDPDQLDSDLDEIGDYCEYPLQLAHVDVLPGHFVFAGSLPGEQVVVLWSRDLGSRELGICGELDVGLDDARRFAEGTSDARGSGLAHQTIRPGAAGETLYFRAVEPETCRVSEIIEVQVAP
jgi:hypothetical protein